MKCQQLNCRNSTVANLQPFVNLYAEVSTFSFCLPTPARRNQFSFADCCTLCGTRQPHLLLRPSWDQTASPTVAPFVGPDSLAYYCALRGTRQPRLLLRPSWDQTASPTVAPFVGPDSLAYCCALRGTRQPRLLLRPSWDQTASPTVAPFVGPDSLAYCCTLRETRWHLDSFVVMSLPPYIVVTIWHGVGLAMSFLLQVAKPSGVKFHLVFFYVIYLNVWQGG